MNLYVESSAVLAWLLEESAADSVEAAFDQAEEVVASDLTLLECDRALIRAHTWGALSEAEVLRRSSLLEAVSSHWTCLQMDREILARARQPLPIEPVRTLDSLHIATALTARSAFSDLALLSLDGRVRQNGAALGFDVLPA